MPITAFAPHGAGRLQHLGFCLFADIRKAVGHFVHGHMLKRTVTGSGVLCDTAAPDG